MVFVQKFHSFFHVFVALNKISNFDNHLPSFFGPKIRVDFILSCFQLLWLHASNVGHYFFLETVLLLLDVIRIICYKWVGYYCCISLEHPRS